LSFFRFFYKNPKNPGFLETHFYSPGFGCVSSIIRDDCRRKSNDRSYVYIYLLIYNFIYVICEQADRQESGVSSNPSVHNRPVLLLSYTK